MSTPAEREQFLVDGVHSIALAEQQLSFHEAEARWTQLLADFLANCPEDWERLEARRRVAEGILLAACWKARPFDECDRLRRVLNALGFSNIDIKTTCLTTFARCCLKQGRAETGLGLMRDLLAELEAVGSEAEGHVQHVRRLVEELAAQA
jgi:hypothetical protein